MSKKSLNLTIEESVKKRAKRYARAHGISLSAVVERFLDEMAAEETEFTPEPGSAVSALMGSLDLPGKYKGMDYKEIKKQILSEKHAR